MRRSRAIFCVVNAGASLYFNASSKDRSAHGFGAWRLFQLLCVEKTMKTSSQLIWIDLQASSIVPLLRSLNPTQVGARLFAAESTALESGAVLEGAAELAVAPEPASRVFLVASS